MGVSCSCNTNETDCGVEIEDPTYDVKPAAFPSAAIKLKSSFRGFQGRQVSGELGTQNAMIESPL
jgi:hypothetical protein